MRLHNPGPLEGEKQREGHLTINTARTDKRRAPTRRTPVENGLSRDGQTVFWVDDFCLAPTTVLSGTPASTPEVQQFRAGQIGCCRWRRRTPRYTATNSVDMNHQLNPNMKFTDS
jgi:hypothetical protein